MNISTRRFELKLKHTFTIAKFSRTATPILLLNLSYDGFIGFGEASMVPYMGENFTTAEDFLNKIDLSWIRYPFDYEAIMAYLDAKAAGHPAIKASIDIALHDLHGKIEQLPCYKLFDTDPKKMPATSYTIGIDTLDLVAQKVIEAGRFHILKIKLGRENDKKVIETIRSLTNKPLFADANQGWTDRHKALDTICWLEEKGVLLIEQPMSKDDPDSNAWITENSPIPIIGDEAVQHLTDVEKSRSVYHGINVKLMKSAGMYEARQMILKAREFGM